MSLGKAANSKEVITSKNNINNINKQLTNGFLRAVKLVSASSMELLQAHKLLQKAAEAHAAAVNKFIDSASDAQAPAVAQSRALRGINMDYEKCTSLHKETLGKLAEMATNANIYSNDEREQLKELWTGYTRREKEILKKFKKGEKVENQLRMSRFQSTYRDKSMLNNKAKRAVILNDVKDLILFYAGEEDYLTGQQEIRYKFFVDKHMAWFQSFIPLITAVLSTPNSMEEAPLIESAEEKKTHAEINEINEDADKDENAVDCEAEESVQVDSSTLTNTLLGPLTQVDTLPQKPEPDIKTHGNDYIENAQRRGVAVPVMPIGQLPTQSQLKRVAPKELVDEEVQTSPPTSDSGVMKITTLLPPLAATAPALAPKPRRSSPVEVVVPSPFHSRDYGKTLNVIEDFNASSGEQLTVNRGDKVMLIQNGSRGWIFIKDCVSLRTGWIPAPFAVL